jgi:hypothetical protein
LADLAVSWDFSSVPNTDYYDNVGVAYYDQYTVGFAFTVGPTNVSVTQLGVFDRLGNGLTGSHRVAIFDDDSTHGTYKQMVAGPTTITAAAEAGSNNGGIYR